MLTLGTIEVYEALPVTAYAGEHGRVYVNANDGTFDKANTALAQRYLSKVAEPGGLGPWKAIFEMIEKDPDLFEAAVALARWNFAKRGGAPK